MLDFRFVVLFHPRYPCDPRLNFLLSGLTRITARNVVLEMGDRCRLTGDHPFDQIADRNNPAQGVSLHDRQVPDSLLGHHPQAIFDRLSRCHRREMS